MLKSRLQTRKSKKRIKSISIILVLIIIGVIFSYKLAIPTVIKLSLLFENSSSNQSSHDNNQSVNKIIAPPILLDTSSATNSASISVSGYTENNQLIVLFVNNEKVDQTKSDNKGEFEFENINLRKGSNNIYAKVKTDGEKMSNKSNILTIDFSNEKPIIKELNASDGQNVNSSDFTIKGRVENSDSLTINNGWVSIRPDGSFEKNIFLNPGDNLININASNNFGNSTSIDLKIIRQD